MKFTELTVKEFENFVQNPSLESHYFQMKENIQTRENDGFCTKFSNSLTVNSVNFIFVYSPLN